MIGQVASDVFKDHNVIGQIDSDFYWTSSGWSDGIRLAPAHDVIGCR